MTVTLRAGRWAILGLCAAAAPACTKDFDGLLGDGATGDGSTAASSLGAGGNAPGPGGGPSSSAATGGAGATAGSGGIGSGGLATGGQGATRVCDPGNSDELVDDFQDSMPTGWTTYAAGSAIVEEAQGKLMVHVTDTTGNGNFAGYTSSAALDLRGCHVTVHALDIPVDDVQAYIGFGDAASDNAVAIGADQGTISFCSSVDGVSDCADEPHTPADAAWWRVRASSSELMLETSPDGAQWTVRRTITPLPAYVAAGYASLGAGSEDAVEGSYDSALDDFNIPP